MNSFIDQAVLQAALRTDFGTFIAKVLQTVSPGDKYLHNWHIDAVAHALMDVHRGSTQRLIITQPPRSLKSICTSVAFVAWRLGHDPTLRFICVSYSAELAATFARQFRAVITSPWYRALFPGVKLVKVTETECETTLGGGRVAIAVGGSLTGRGADVIIIDDPIKAEDAQSEKTRYAVNEWFGTTLLSRLDDKTKGAIVLIMQRLHEDDLAGKLICDGGWEHLDLPAIAQEDQRIPIGPNAFHIWRKGEVLHPARESLAVLDGIKRAMGSLAFSAQYLQRPIPLDGNLIKRSWIKWYEEAPSRLSGVQLVQSWDIATTTTATSDYSVCTTWLIQKRNYYLFDVWRGQLEFPQLMRQVVELAHFYKPNRILMEAVGPGLHLIQAFQANPIQGVPIPIRIQPKGEKLVRMEAQSACIEAGQVHFPRKDEWLDELLRELLGFPHSRYDDQVDSISQFLNWAESRMIYQPTISLCGPKIIPSD